MKNRNSIYQGLSRASIGMLAACMTLTACDKDQEFTPAMLPDYNCPGNRNFRLFSFPHK